MDAVREAQRLDRFPGRNNRAEALRQVQAAADHLRVARERQDDAVVAARAQGATWSDLGRALGVSHQAVQQRYGAPPARGR